jgi:N6-L-threonylcarbamoyladenine synthase
MKKQKIKYILGIESSCDETAASVVRVDQKTKKVSVITNIISSQIEIHKKYGGVVPEVAAREHVLNILPVINEALEKANISAKEINLLAVTKGPGLITSLITGLETVRALSFAWQIPVLEINHIEGHIYSNFINLEKPIKFPAIILTVSGGHTNLILRDKNQKIKIIGETLDDAAGEAYDKGAKMLGLGYPGGPIVSKLANEFKNNNGISDIELPRPMINNPDFNFSFSGLKTALLYKLQKDKNWAKRQSEYCFAYQEAIIDTLINKTIKAAKKYKVNSVMLSGGVSANEELRKKMAEAVKKDMPCADFFLPAREYTTDNAAMIATAAAFLVNRRKTTPFSKLKVDPSLQLK